VAWQRRVPDPIAGEAVRRRVRLRRSFFAPEAKSAAVDALSCTLAGLSVNCFSLLSKGDWVKDTSGMLLVRDYVGHMASEVIKRLIEGNLIESKAPEAVTQRVRQRMMEELTVEDRLNDEVREILIQHQDEMRRTGASYQEMYKKVKGQLARDRKLVLR